MNLKSFTSYDFPDSKGHFGPYGGSFVSETLFAALEKLDQDYSFAINDKKFWRAQDFCAINGYKATGKK